jgi:hypothetical protein
MKQTRRIAIAAALFCVLAIATVVLVPRIPHESFVIPNEKAVAAELLSEKLSGSRYFQPASPAANSAGSAPPADGEPQISVADARTQVVGIVKERQFDPDHCREARCAD